MKIRYTIFSVFLLLMVSKLVSAHCPLCTAGAALAAGTATWLGVKVTIIGLFIGAFATSLGFWVSNVLKKKSKKYFFLQTPLIVILSFLLTLIPIMPIVKSDSMPIKVWITGEVGSFLNKTYWINKFLLGGVIGLLIVVLSPSLSKGVTKIRKGKIFPFQGVIITLSLLIITALIIHLWI